MQLHAIPNASPIAMAAPPTANEGLSDTARDEARFARLLHQNQAAAARAQAAPPTARADAPSASEPARKPSSGGLAPTGPAATPSQPHPPASRNAPAPERERSAPQAGQRPHQASTADSTDARSPDKRGATDTRDDVSAAHASVDAGALAANPSLAALQFSDRVPVDAATSNGAAADASDAAAASLDTASQAAADARLRREPSDLIPADAQDASSSADPHATGATDAPAAGFAAQLAEPAGRDQRLAAHAPGVEAARPGAALAAISAPSHGAAAADPLGAPMTLTLPTPIDSPDFAQALGVQMSVLARDGVQRAELHLNPADMGPVSVHIVMQGTQARIDFGADLAATRHAIEAGLPGLAGAMRDAGFTLAGGCVSHHSSHPRGGNDHGGSAPRRIGGHDGEAVDEIASVAHVRRNVVRSGGVDLYA